MAFCAFLDCRFVPLHTPSPAPQRPVTLVTGGARRIGLAIACELAAAGHDLALHVRRQDGEAAAAVQDAVAQLQALGARVAVLAADLGDDSACAELLPRAVAALGRVDALVNNASRFDYDAPGPASPHALTPEALRAHWQANTVAPVMLAQALAQHVAERGGQACVVNLLDQKLWNPNPDYFSYTLSKAALREATVLLAQALAPAVRVVGVAPGVTLVSGPMNEAEFAAAHQLTPLQRSSTPQDIARAVRFCIESPAITGTTLLVDGGQHLAAQARDVLFLAQQTLNSQG